MDQRLQLTKIRLQNLRRPQTLFETAVEVFVRIVESAVHEEDEAKKETVYLPDHALQMILDRLMSKKSMNGEENYDKFEIRLSYFINLINPFTREIDLSNFMTFCPDLLKAQQISRVLHMIATFATKITSLTFKKKDIWFPSSFFLSQNAIEGICRMTTLQKLEINECSIQFSTLKHVCESLPNLNHVDVNMANNGEEEYYSFSDADFQRSFSRLKVFIFRKNYCRFTQRCIRLLPSLEIVSNSANDLLSLGGYLLPPEPPLAPSALRHLCVDVAKIQPGQLTWFPNVTHLKIQFEENQSRSTPSHATLEDLLRFKKIKSLFLLSCPAADILDRFLKQYGGHLHSLCVHSSVRRCLNYSFRNIFKACPNLETLMVLLGVQMADAKLDFFAKLKHLQWFDGYDYYETRQAAQMQPRSVRLSNILSAPLLQNFEMVDFRNNLEELKLVSSLIAEKKILNNLSTFRYISRRDSSHDAFSVALSELTKNASAFLPKLIRLETSLNAPGPFLSQHHALAHNIGPFVTLLKIHESQVTTPWIVDCNIEEGATRIQSPPRLTSPIFSSILREKM
ncbi:Hypothetical predicted protein [Cloeon dipterum]|uniref:F-box domain-containing protein n=1 Tax=Cloeon dipterum TaxID=197152 RepID=A0A8S1E7B1_9INSE|nr:Hypothetical predicted protein [Cloeon dipterum]